MVFKTAKNFFLNRIIPILLVGLILVLSVPDTVFASSTTDNQATDEDPVGSSMYDVSVALASFANNVVGPNANDNHTDTSKTGDNAHKLVELNKENGGKVGNAGAIVGYVEPNQNTTYIMNNNNRGASSASYEAYENIGDDGNTYAYTRYGRLLTDLGIDSVGNPASVSSGRSIGGLVMEGVHLLSQVIPSIFNFALGVLDVINPFRFLVNTDASVENANTVVSVGQGGAVNNALTITNPFNNADKEKTSMQTEENATLATQDRATDNQLEEELNNGSVLDSDMVGTNVTNEVTNLTGSTVFTDITAITTSIYIQLRAIGLWIIIPLLFVFFIAGVLFRGTTKGMGGRLVRFLERFVFVIIGIPILGLMYTAFLEQLSEDIQINEPSSRVIACTFCDFADWAADARLAPPSGSIILESEITSNSGESGEASGNTYRTVRETIYQLNYNLLKNSNNKSLLVADSGLGLAGSSDNTYDTTGGMYNATSNGLINTTVSSAEDGDTEGRFDTFTALNNLILSYQSADMYTAPTWESSVNATISSAYKSDMGSSASTADASTNKETVYQMYYDTDEVDDWMNREISDNSAIFSGKKSGSNEEAAWAAKGFNIFTHGDKLSSSTFIVESNNTVSGYPTIEYRSTSNGVWSGTATNPNTEGGLSCMALYNYLESSFNDKQITVYSAANTTSEYTRLQHYSVNMAGSGAMGFLFALNAAGCLLVYVALGFSYAIGMCWHVLKQGFTMLIHVPAALLGAVGSIVQVVIIVVGMILEILITVLMYKIVMECIFTIASLLEQPLMNFFEGLNVSGTAIGGLMANTSGISIIETLADSRAVFGIGLGLITLLVIVMGCVGIRLNRVLLTAWAFVWQKLYGLLVFDEWRDEYWKLMAEEKSLYVWDDIGMDIDSWIENHERSANDIQIPVIEGGTA